MTADRSGMLISFDGLDSSGKATQARLLAAHLRQLGHTVHEFATPDYNTPSGQELKKRLQNKIGNWETTPWREKLDYFARNRVEHREEVLSALAAGEVVIYDRYVPSSLTFIAVEALLAEPKLERSEIYKAVEEAEYKANNMPVEDISIFLDVPPRVAATLLEKRKEKLADEDEYTDHVAVQERLHNEYALLLESGTERMLRIVCVVDNQLLSVHDTQELVWANVRARLPQLMSS